MKTLVVFIAGIYIARAVIQVQAMNEARERDLKLRKALEQFLQVNAPGLSGEDIQQKINTLLKAQ